VEVGAMTAIETTRRRKGLGFLVLFALTIPAVNWLIGHAGTVWPGCAGATNGSASCRSREFR
jgi:hypothetical protein